MAKTVKKETAKAVEAPKAEVKTEVKAAAKVAAPVEKKVEAPKAEKKAPVAKKAAEKKAPAKKAEKAAPATVKTVEIQLGEQSIAYDAIVKKVVKAAKGAKVVDVYVKVDENKIYFVADKNETQSIDLF